MKLIKLKCIGGGDIYINPEAVATVEGDVYNCKVSTFGGEDHSIADSTESVVKQLTEYIPKEHY